MKAHTKILLGLLLGAAAGLALQQFADASFTLGADGIERLEQGCARDNWLAPFRLAANVIMNLLRMLIVPLILTSIVSGVAGLSGGREFGRLGTKTFGWYTMTSLLVLLVGLAAINLTRPGVGAGLPLAVPENYEAVAGRSFSDNALLLQASFFALISGFFIGRLEEPHRARMMGCFESGFELMMRVAEWVLKLIPYGVFVLMVKVMGETGLSAFRPLLFHAAVVLPLMLRVFGRVSPWAWFRAMTPALLTAFRTSSSSVTLSVTLETVEKRGGVPNKISSFTRPLGATGNMGGTALCECVGVIFLSQFYASVAGFDLTFADQIYVVIAVLMASIGAAGIPSAGLVMMTAILSGLGLPAEGAILLLAIGRPLDMLRTGVNVWSDTCAAAAVARSEGHTVLAAPTT